MEKSRIVNLMLARQHLITKADEGDYLALYQDLQPGQNVYWNGFGDPPSLSFRAGFDDIAFNRRRQREHELIKGRFAGGNLGWIVPADLGLFTALYRKPLDSPTPNQQKLLELIETLGPLNIQQMKQELGWLVKEITPVLHRLQQAFLVYEDQYDGEWDRGWYRFGEMFPDLDWGAISREAVLKTLLVRFARRLVWFDSKMAKSFYKLPEKEIKVVIAALLAEGILMEAEGGYLLTADMPLLEGGPVPLPRSVFALHRNDFLVKSNEHWLKERFRHPDHETLQYLLVDGAFRGAVVGHFRNGPYDLEDVLLDLPEPEAMERKGEILAAVELVNYGGEVKGYRSVM